MIVQSAHGQTATTVKSNMDRVFSSSCMRNYLDADLATPVEMMVMNGASAYACSEKVNAQTTMMLLSHADAFPGPS
jgi:hypothetical protein